MADHLYRLSPWGESVNSRKWGEGGDLEGPNVGGCLYVHENNTENGTSRLYIDFNRAWEGRWIFGYFARIGHAKQSANTETPYRMTIVARIAFKEFGATYRKGNFGGRVRFSYFG